MFAVRSGAFSINLIESGDDRGVWISQNLNDGWVARVRLVRQGGRIVAGELRIFSTRRATPPGGLKKDIARRVAFGSFQSFVLASRERFHSDGLAGDIFASVVGKPLRLDTSPLRPRPRQRRDFGRDDRFYAIVTRDYLDAIQRSERPTPIRDLATARKVSRSKVRDMVHEARERGLLSPSEPGKVGGTMTARCIALLQSVEGKAHK